MFWEKVYFGLIKSVRFGVIRICKKWRLWSSHTVIRLPLSKLTVFTIIWSHCNHYLYHDNHQSSMPWSTKSESSRVSSFCPVGPRLPDLLSLHHRLHLHWKVFFCCKCPIEALSFIGRFPQKIISANVILLHSAARYELFNSNLQIYCCWLSSSGKASLHTDKVKDLSDFFNFLKNTLFYTF